jgi:hypothetical protein
MAEPKPDPRLKGTLIKVENPEEGLTQDELDAILRAVGGEPTPLSERHK